MKQYVDSQELKIQKNMLELDNAEVVLCKKQSI